MPGEITRGRHTKNDDKILASMAVPDGLTKAELQHNAAWVLSFFKDQT